MSETEDLLRQHAAAEAIFQRRELDNLLAHPRAQETTSTGESRIAGGFTKRVYESGRMSTISRQGVRRRNR